VGGGGGNSGAMKSPLTLALLILRQIVESCEGGCDAAVNEVSDCGLDCCALCPIVAHVVCYLLLFSV
jgi:hypothetical protein